LVKTSGIEAVQDKINDYHRRGKLAQGVLAAIEGVQSKNHITAKDGAQVDQVR